jgi:hypothetical protein
MPVTLTSNRPVEIYEQEDSGGEQQAVSVKAANSAGPPAEIWLRKQGRFRIGGAGITTERFRLPAEGQVNLEIKPGSRARNIAGLVVFLTGTSAAAAGVWTMVASIFVAAGEQSTGIGPPGWLPPSKQTLYTGAVLLPVGATAIVAGLITYSLGKTRYTITPTYLSTAQRSPGGLLLSARGVEF